MSFKSKFKTKLIQAAFHVFRIFPLQDKVVATTMRGRKYGDNPGYILEYLHSVRPELKLVWLHHITFKYSIPSFIKSVSYYNSALRKVYEMATAKVWINSHRFEPYIRKRRGQLFVETWHGGLGIKKIEGDLEEIRSSAHYMSELHNTNKMADVFISQSDHLSNIYRSAFGYKGPIYKCGYPKNDCILNDDGSSKQRVHERLGIPSFTRLCLYAPTFRTSFEKTGKVDFNVYDIDFNRLHDSLVRKFGGEWKILLKWHPIMLKSISSFSYDKSKVLDVTGDNDMQSLIMAADAMISDYSSCIFDAELRRIPCFTFATDFEDYKAERGVYYEMDELPFPYARNNDELERHILGFDDADYQQKLDAFNERTGLYETGHATEDIGNKILDFIDGKKVVWE